MTKDTKGHEGRLGHRLTRKRGGLFELFAEGGELGFEVGDFLAKVGNFFFETGDGLGVETAGSG